MSRTCAAMLTAAAVSALSSTASLAGEEQQPTSLHITYDQSTALRLEKPAKIVIVGNPSIADAQLINSTTVYITGRMFGTTNIIAVDADGNEVINKVVGVGAPDTVQVTVYRGPEGQRNFACAPRCERSVTPGDPDMSTLAQAADKKVDSAQRSALLDKR